MKKILFLTVLALNSITASAAHFLKTLIPEQITSKACCPTGSIVPNKLNPFSCKSLEQQEIQLPPCNARLAELWQKVLLDPELNDQPQQPKYNWKKWALPVAGITMPGTIIAYNRLKTRPQQQSPHTTHDDINITESSREESIPTLSTYPSSLLKNQQSNTSATYNSTLPRAEITWNQQSNTQTIQSQQPETSSQGVQTNLSETFSQDVQTDPQVQELLQLRNINDSTSSCSTTNSARSTSSYSTTNTSPPKTSRDLKERIEALRIDDSSYSSTTDSARSTSSYCTPPLEICRESSIVTTDKSTQYSPRPQPNDVGTNGIQYIVTTGTPDSPEPNVLASITLQPNNKNGTPPPPPTSTEKQQKATTQQTQEQSCIKILEQINMAMNIPELESVRGAIKILKRQLPENNGQKDNEHTQELKNKIKFCEAAYLKKLNELGISTGLNNQFTRSHTTPTHTTQQKQIQIKK